MPFFFEDYLFEKSFDCDFIPCSSNPPYTARGEPDNLLTGLDLEDIPWLGTCRRDFAPTIDMVFKYHTFVSK